MTLDKRVKFISPWTGSQMLGLMSPSIQPDVLIFHDVSNENMTVQPINYVKFRACRMTFLFILHIDYATAAVFSLHTYMFI